MKRRKEPGVIGIAPIVSGKRCTGAVTTQGEIKELDRGKDYWTIDANDLGELLSSQALTGNCWTVFLSGQLPILAVNDINGTTIRSLHRVKAWDLSGRPRTPEARSAQAERIARLYLDAQEKLGVPLGCGFTQSVSKLAPDLVKIKRHAGHNIFYREKMLRGGRNEVIQRESAEPTRQYDLRSAYAGVYSNGIPGKLERRSHSVPSGKPFFADVTVKIHESTRIPLAPVRAPSGLLTFPTGTFRTWLSSPEFHQLDQIGHIQTVHSVDVFDWINPFASLVEKVYGLRRQTPCDVAKALCKVILTSAFGVLCSQPSYLIWKVRPYSPPDYGFIAPGFFQQESTPRQSLSHVPAASYITSAIRAKIGNVISQVESYYCAVDSVVIPHDAPLVEGENPGDWQLVDCHDAGSRWIAPGVYELGSGSVRKASGVEKEQQEAFLLGNVVTVERKASPASAIASGEINKGLVQLRLSQDKTQKRIDIGGGKTRAPTWEETRRMLWQKAR